MTRRPTTPGQRVISVIGAAILAGCASNTAPVHQTLPISVGCDLCLRRERWAAELSLVPAAVLMHPSIPFAPEDQPTLAAGGC